MSIFGHFIKRVIKRNHHDAGWYRTEIGIEIRCNKTSLSLLPMFVNFSRYKCSSKCNVYFGVRTVYWFSKTLHIAYKLFKLTNYQQTVQLRFFVHIFLSRDFLQSSEIKITLKIN